MASIMLSAASQPTLAKNARTGHPRSDVGNERKDCGQGWATRPTGHPKISATSKGDSNLHMEFAGANPLVPGSPDINTKLDMSGQVNSGQVCYSGTSTGMRFRTLRLSGSIPRSRQRC